MSSKYVKKNLEPWDENNPVLGEGSYSKVYAGFVRETHHHPRTAVAIKVLKRIPEHAVEQRKVWKAWDIEKKLQFPSLLSIVDFSTSSERWYTVSLQAKCSLGKMLKDANRGTPQSWKNASGETVVWNSTKRAICAIGIAGGLEFMHKKGYIHRDIKPDNVLLDENMHPLITDFGLSREIPKDVEEITRAVGTPLYMAPEVLSGEVYGAPADVYAFGMLVYQLLTLKAPFQGRTLTLLQLGELLRKGERPGFDSGVAEEWRDLIEKCWSQDPGERPSMEEVGEALSNANFSTFESGIDQGELDEYRKMITEALKKAKQENKHQGAYFALQHEFLWQQQLMIWLNGELVRFDGET